MRSLPDEGQASQHKLLPNKSRHTGHHGKTNNKLARYRVEVKKLSQRLNAYADGGFAADVEVMRLLQDTRSQVLNLHIARKSLHKQKKPHTGANNHHRRKRPRD